MPESKQKQRWIYQELRWLYALCIVSPILFLGILELTRYFYLEEIMSRLVERFTVITIMFCGVLGFSSLIFTIIHRLQKAAEDQRIQLQSLNEIGLELSAEHELDDILPGVVRYACATIEAHYGALIFTDQSKETPAFIVHNDSNGPQVVEESLMATGVLGAIVHGGRSILIDNLQSPPQLVGFPKGHPIMTSLIGVPIVSHSKIIGGLYLCNRVDGTDFTGEHLSTLSLLATQTAVAIDNARLYERLGRLSVLEERQRFAMDLHDGAIQSLYAVGLQIESLLDQQQDMTHGHIQVDGARNRMKMAVTEINGVIKELRNYIFNLNQSDKQPGRISVALRHEVVRLRSHGIDRIDMDLTKKLTKNLDRELYVIERALHECVSNVIKHSGATAVSLILESDANSVRLRVEDNGIGDHLPLTVEEEGHGLKNIRARLLAVGGKLELDSPPGGGYRAILHIPIPIMADQVKLANIRQFKTTGIEIW